ncbi:MAG: energy-coupling factor transporter ATPase [Spirochaetales bacterium]|nr:energy-coupling factor transporter ATPase [Spirochaetales bacterium]
MSFIEFRDVRFTYPGQKEAALKNISFSLDQGSHTAVIGGNGSGKSTLARLMTGLLVPEAGDVLVDGNNSRDTKLHRQIRTRAGLVFQNPSTQIVATVVREDTAFGPENLALDSEEIRKRVRTALENTELSSLSGRETHMLSAGQQQRLAMAGILAMGTGCLILDEAESMLNPRGRKEMYSLLASLHAEGFTIIRITHFMDQAAGAEQIMILHEGELVSRGCPVEIFRHTPFELNRWSLRPSPVQELAAFLDSPGVNDTAGGMKGEVLLQEEDFIERLKEVYPDISGKGQAVAFSTQSAGRTENVEQEVPDVRDSQTSASTAVPVITLKSVSRTYGSKSPHPVKALEDISFTLRRGESVSVMGTTGSGKSTFLQMMNSLLLPDTGELTLLGQNPLDKKTDLAVLRSRIGLVMQQPEKQLFASLVGDDVAFGPRQTGIKGKELSRRVRDALERVGLSYRQYRDFPVRALSGGQKRKAALAGVLAMNPEILLLDEPTAGLDPQSAESLEAILLSLHREGISLVTVTHNVEQALRLSDRLLVFRDGKLSWDGPASGFFQSHDPADYGLEYPLSSRIAGALDLHPLPVTPEELRARLEPAV